MKKCLFLMAILMIPFFVSCADAQKITLTKAGIISEYFVRARLKNPEEVEFSGGYRGSEETGNKFMVYQKVSTRNDFGVRKSMVYKIHMIYKGGEWEDKNNWTYDLLIIEEEDTGKQYKFYSPNDR